jgi:predicted ATPase
MITKWKIANFKSIREVPEIELGPLTIFAGANSSGKSTFIQSVLLIAQTLAHKVGSRSVVLNGALTSLGQFDDLKSSNSTSEQITLKCTCRPLNDSSSTRLEIARFGTRGSAFYDPLGSRLEEVSCEISFDADSSSSQRDLFQIQPHLFATRLSCLGRDEENLDQRATVSIVSSQKIFGELMQDSDIDELSEQLRTSLGFDVTLDDRSLNEVRDDYISAKPIGCFLKHFLPDRILYQLDELAERANRITASLQDGRPGSKYYPASHARQIVLTGSVVEILLEALDSVPGLRELFLARPRQTPLFADYGGSLTLNDWQNWLRGVGPQERAMVLQKLRDSDNLFDRILHALKSSDATRPDSTSFVPALPPRLINSAVRYLDSFFSTSLKYLGPLRDAPRPLYPLAPAADPNDVGLRGEHTASILDLHKRKQIQYIPSEVFLETEIDRDRKPVTRSLEAAVVDWLQYLGVAESVASKDKGKLGHELKVSLANSDIEHDLTHVGVGVSQVLPILVMCLLAERDSTLVFEQPELHLHPKVQTLLGDFFLSMALCNKQCIVETHSEYFIDRLRFRMAAAPAEKPLTHLSRIYFVEKSNQGSTFREIEVNDYGAIVDWPDGFFDQSQQQAEQILRAASQKRKNRRGKHDE